MHVAIQVNACAIYHKVPQSQPEHARFTCRCQSDHIQHQQFNTVGACLAVLDSCKLDLTPPFTTYGVTVCQCNSTHTTNVIKPIWSNQYIQAWLYRQHQSSHGSLCLVY
ncbi:hypothetical protein O5D80_002541 [Batrachochytrium dendrobatidis]|nr:hypothetical protein O5D80_002541 [Batrachochytrium dendrobatidis]